jgi:hypothetical protein
VFLSSYILKLYIPTCERRFSGDTQRSSLVVVNYGNQTYATMPFLKPELVNYKNLNVNDDETIAQVKSVIKETYVD